eukprot:9553186-Prorocentrum_lima.AAC.1
MQIRGIVGHMLWEHLLNQRFEESAFQYIVCRFSSIRGVHALFGLRSVNAMRGTTHSGTKEAPQATM